MVNEVKIGEVVNFVLAPGVFRPAIVVNCWGGTTANLQVFLDGTNDSNITLMNYGQVVTNNMLWVTSVIYSESKEPRTWHLSDAGLRYK